MDSPRGLAQEIAEIILMRGRFLRANPVRCLMVCVIHKRPAAEESDYMAVRLVSVVATFFLAAHFSAARERTVKEFRAYAARHIVDADKRQLDSFVTKVDSNADGTITDIEFADRIVMFQQVFKSVPIREHQSDQELPQYWLTDFAKARKPSARTGKPIVAMFSASWCGPCKRMIARVYPTDEAKEALREFVPVYIDSEKHRELAAMNGIRSFPTFICFNVDGAPVTQHVGGGTVKDFVEMLQSFRNAIPEAAQPINKQKPASES